METLSQTIPQNSYLDLNRIKDGSSPLKSARKPADTSWMWGDLILNYSVPNADFRVSSSSTYFVLGTSLKADWFPTSALGTASIKIVS